MSQKLLKYGYIWKNDITKFLTLGINSLDLGCSVCCRFPALAVTFRMFGFRSNPLVGCFSGVPSQKPKEQQRSVLRPAVLQAPPTKTLPEPSKSSEFTHICLLSLCILYLGLGPLITS